MKEESSKYKKKRKNMVEKQIIRRGIKNEKIIEAFLAVPRHIFVPEKLRERSYEDRPLPVGNGQTISQPYIVAEMIEELEPEENDIILEIGTGTGYAAAVLSRIVKKVYTVERIKKLADKAEKLYDRLKYNNIEVKVADGTKGWPEKAPFSGIMVSAAAPEIPESLIEQLEEGGIIVIPVGNKLFQRLIKAKYKDGKIKKSNLGGVRFVSLIGEEGWKK